ncbi:MAG: DegT/DnrJ/EryC1/StrS family aminotransferase [bacterium]|nr:DegT/DnrJ/EryC1/StrS family aminotransferase [bacterium]
MSPTRKSKLAVNGGTPVRGPEKKGPSWPIFDNTERTALSEVFESGNWWYGDHVTKFEKDFAHFQDAKYCITCTSGTTATEIVLEALGVGAGDEVIVPPYTFIATATSVARVGATPVFVDVDESWSLNPDLVEKAITKRTKAIVPVHFAGRVADMDRILAIAEKHKLPVLEDACHSWGSKWKGTGAGAIGAAGVFSFQMSKNLTAGEGGAILTNDEGLAKTCRSLINCGRSEDGEWYEHPLIGTNARLTEFAGALLGAQLTRLEDQTLRREKNAAILDHHLGAIEGLTPQPGDDRITRRSYHLYCIRIDPDAFGCSRERLCEAVRAEGLYLGAGYAIPLYRQPAFENLLGKDAYPDGACPLTEDLCYRSGAWLAHPMLLGRDSDIKDVTAIFKKVKENVHELAD